MNLMSQAYTEVRRRVKPKEGYRLLLLDTTDSLCCFVYKKVTIKDKKDGEEQYECFIERVKGETVDQFIKKLENYTINI
jgi:hypothetical protein